MALGLASLYLHTPERINILWSIAYFIVDLLDSSLVRHDLLYTLHHACCLVLGLANYHLDVLRVHRMNSKAAFCELSTPFLHAAQATREPWRFVLFALVFTLCRMVWIPIMYAELYGPAGLGWKHPVQLVFGGFYVLNCFWYMKIVRILVTGGKRKKKETTKESRSEVSKPRRVKKED